MRPILPRPPETFMGRDEELQRLLSLHPRERLIALQGPPGIGKSALALRFLDELRRDDASLEIVYVRCLEGWTVDDVAAAVEDADEHGLRAVPATLEERLLAFVHRLNERDPYLLLDDVHVLPDDELTALLETLQAHLRARVLITSSREVHGAAEVCHQSLGGLPGAAASALMQRLLEALGEGTVPERLVDHVAGHPFLLRLLAGLVVTHALDASLASGTSTDLRAWVLESVMAEVDADERAALEVIATARVPLPARLVGDVAGVPRIDDTLASLERRFLVERESRERVRVHRVLGEHIRAHMDDGRGQAVHASLAARLRAAGQPEQAFHHALAGGRTAEAAAILAESAASLCERGLYLPLLDDVRELEAAGADVPPQVRLMEAKALSLAGRTDEALRLLRELSAATDDASVLVDVLTSTGGAHLNSGHYQQALACYEEALALCGQETPQAALFKCLDYMGLIHGSRGEMRRAFDLLGRSLAMARKAGLDAARAHAMRVQATLHALAEEHDMALAVARKCIDLALSLDALRVAAYARYAAALAHRGKREYAAAREMLEAMRADGEARGDLNVQAQAHLELGQVAFDDDCLEEAQGHLQTALRRFREQGDGLGAARAVLRLGLLRLEEGAGEEARGLFRAAAHAAAERGDPRLEAEALLALADEALQRGAVDEAEPSAQEARVRLQALDLPLLSSEAALLLAEIEIRRGDPTAAVAWMATLQMPAGRGLAVVQRAAALAAQLGARLGGGTVDAGQLRGSEIRRCRRVEARLGQR